MTPRQLQLNFPQLAKHIFSIFLISRLTLDAHKATNPDTRIISAKHAVSTMTPFPNFVFPDQAWILKFS